MVRAHYGYARRPIAALLAEAYGTFVLTLVDAALGILHSRDPVTFSLLLRSFAPAFVVMSLIFTIGEVSGAHINPAVTLSFAVRGVFPWRRVPLYFAFQILGAVIAAIVLRYGFVFDYSEAMTNPLGGVPLSAATELIASFFLVTAILSCASASDVKGPEAAVPVGITIAFCSFFAKGISGASMNPARSLGPALVAGRLDNIWIYLVVPVMGGLLAVAFTRVLRGPPTSEDRKAAQGQ